MARPQIVGLGGYPHDALLDYVLGMARGPRVLYVPTANMENPYAALDWSERVGASVLRFHPWPPADLRSYVLGFDVALVDSAGAHFVGTELHEIVTASSGAGGYRVDEKGETPLEARFLS